MKFIETLLDLKANLKTLDKHLNSSKGICQTIRTEF